MNTKYRCTRLTLEVHQRIMRGARYGDTPDNMLRKKYGMKKRVYYRGKGASER